MITLDPSPLYYWMAKVYSENKTPDNKITLLNEGGFRSAKTWDAAHLIFTFCDHNRYGKMPLEIGVFRNMLKDCREKTYEKDFKKAGQMSNIYDRKDILKENQSPEWYLWGNKISFLGLDELTEQPSFDIVFINETLEVNNENKIKGLYGRCKMLFIRDWNPRYTHHWVFDWEGRPDVFFSHTTYKNNKHLEKSIVTFIESTSPWHLDDLDLPEDQRRPNEENIKNKTVDKWYFLVYGMGIRASREGLVFPFVTYVNEMPKDIEYVSYGVDFGETAETAIVKSGLKLKPKGQKHDLYLQKLFYKPTETSKDVVDVVIALKITTHLWCDNNQDNENAGIGWVHDMRAAGIHAVLTRKFPGSRAYWIASLKNFNIHIVKDPDGDFQREQENFCYRVVDGIQLSETVKKYDHLWSAAGYSVVGDFQHYLVNSE